MEYTTTSSAMLTGSASALMEPPTPIQSGTGRAVAIEFLEIHFERGGIDGHTQWLLSEAVDLLDAISRRLFRSPPRICVAALVAEVDLLSDVIRETCQTFYDHMSEQLEYAVHVRDGLPDLEEAPETELSDRMELWNKALETLHLPSKNDTQMYSHILEHFYDVVMIPFQQLHRREPGHPTWRLYGTLSDLNADLEELPEVCYQANKVVKRLDKAYKRACHRLEASLTQAPVVEVEDPPPLPVIDESGDAVGMKMKRVSVSFSAVEDQLLCRTGFGSPKRQFSLRVRGGSDRYLERAKNRLPQVARPRPARVTRDRVPRAPESPFDLAESDPEPLYLQLNHVRKASEESHNPIQVRDFALSTPRMLPSPASLLQRHDWNSRREEALKARVIGGKLIVSARPRVKGRSQTLDDRHNGLPAWPEGERGGAPSPTLVGRLATPVRKNTA